MANTNLRVSIDNLSQEYKVMTYNVDMALVEEKYKQTMWKNREDRVRNLIVEVNADIVLFQELRRLPNYPDSLISDFLGSFCKYGYGFELAYRGPNDLSFGQAVLFKTNKLYPMETMKKWLSDTPDVVSDTFLDSRGKSGFGAIVFGVRFVPVSEGKVVDNGKSFWAFNTHLLFDESVKTKSCEALLCVLRKVVEPYFLGGDFNFFPDMDGAKQRAILTSAGSLSDLGKNAVTVLSRKEVEGTFVGFEHDNFKANLNNMVSRLDHLFFSPEFRQMSIPVLYNKTMLDPEPEEFTTRNYPSDHLPLVMSVNLDN